MVSRRNPGVRPRQTLLGVISKSKIVSPKRHSSSERDHFIYKNNLRI